MPMTITTTTKFQDIQAKYQETEKQLRFNTKTSELKYHNESGFPTPSRIGKAAEKDRAAKMAAAAEAIRNVIDQQFGYGMGEKVFKKVQQADKSFDPNAVRGTDLKAIQKAITNETSLLG